MSGKKIAKALIGGNWKCNGTVASIKQMAEVLNKAGSFSANSEVNFLHFPFSWHHIGNNICLLFFYLGCNCSSIYSFANFEVHSSS